MIILIVTSSGIVALFLHKLKINNEFRRLVKMFYINIIEYTLYSLCIHYIFS